jgi:hypothetical protein
MKTLSLLCLIGLCALAPVFASEEEFAEWREAQLEFGRLGRAGKVKLKAQVEGTSYKEFEITAFGRKQTLSKKALSQLSGFPLRTLKVTHEAGYPQLGGYSVHFKFEQHSYDSAKTLTTRIAVLTVTRNGFKIAVTAKPAVASHALSIPF